MSQVSHPRITLPVRTRSIWIAALALVAAGAVVLVLAVSAGDSSGTTAVSGGAPARSGPDESRVAAAISGGTQAPTSRPDESRIAASISNR
jgi:hypothetical protein